MSEERLTLLFAALIALGGWTLTRLVGPMAGSVSAMAIITLVQTYRHRRKNRHEQLLAKLRRADPAEHARLLSEISDVQIRQALRSALEREGRAGVDGNAERFPFPDSFRRSVNRQYWFRWALCASALVAAGILRESSLFWSLTVLTIGVVLLFGVWRSSKLQEALQTILVVSPFGVSELWPDGWQRTVLFNSSVQ